MDLLVLAKEPVPGRVKTRLCPPCSPVDAAAVAEAALADTLAAALAAGADRVVLVLDGRPGPWCPPGLVLRRQADGTLPRRLAAAWAEVDGPALQIGMDTPQLGADGLASALRAVDEPAHDVVLGPAEDGGWWGIGMRVPRPDVFDGVATSRADTGRRQVERCEALGLRTTLLASARDVDRWDDALAVAGLAPGGAFAAEVGRIAARRVAA